MHKIKIIIGGLLAALALIFVAPTPAQAADPYIWVCNSSSSDDDIIAYHLTLPYVYRIHRGNCKSIDDRAGGARVDVDPSGGYVISSYKWFKGYYPIHGGSWGPCYNSNNHAANPFSDGHSTTYWSSSKRNCV